MRRFLYISPFFPPLSRVGALRSLKFARHLPNEGWQPVVLCDLHEGAVIDPQLSEVVPPQVVIERDYSAAARSAQQTLEAGSWPVRPPARPGPPPPAKTIGLFRGRDWLPLGEAVFTLPHALRAARQLIAQHGCEAIMVNADPVAALLVGERLARETGLPLVADLRDPWGPCTLRRPLRPLHTRLIEDWAERRVLRRARRLILNTETTREAYLRAYPWLDPQRVTVIRNHGDVELINSGQAEPPEFPVFTLLFLGTFSRFVRSAPLLHLLAELQRRGIGNDRLKLVLTELLDRESMALAERLGVTAYVEYLPPVRYRDVGAAMAAADMLTLVAPTPQRIQAKLYDYLFSERPILAVADDHPELGTLLTETGAGELFASGELTGMADYVLGYLHQGRRPVRPRHATTLQGHSSAAATARLARILEAVTR